MAPSKTLLQSSIRCSKLAGFWNNWYFVEISLSFLCSTLKNKCVKLFHKKIAKSTQFVRLQKENPKFSYHDLYLSKGNRHVARRQPPAVLNVLQWRSLLPAGDPAWCRHEKSCHRLWKEASWPRFSSSCLPLSTHEQQSLLQWSKVRAGTQTPLHAMFFM